MSPPVIDLNNEILIFVKFSVVLDGSLILKYLLPFASIIVLFLSSLIAFEKKSAVD